MRVWQVEDGTPLWADAVCGIPLPQFVQVRKGWRDRLLELVGRTREGISLPPDQDARRFFPLEEGASWEYRGTMEGMEASLMITNHPARRLFDRQVVPQVWELSTTVPLLGKIEVTRTLFLYADVRGVRQWAVQKPEDSNPQLMPAIILKNPVVSGTAWLNYDRTKGALSEIIIESVGETLTVPAGTFQGCAKVVERESSIMWFCPDVGVVKISDSEKILELVSYKKR